MNITSSIRNHNNAKTSRIKTITDFSFLAPGIQQTYYLIDLDGNRVAPENVVMGETYPLKSDSRKLLYL